MTTPLSNHPLPKGWRWVRLGNVCKVVGGATPETGVPQYWGGDIVWITPTDLSDLISPYIHSSKRKITELGYDSCSTESVPTGSVVMSSRAPIGYLGIAAVPLCVNQGCKCFIPGEDVDSQFLFSVLRHHMDRIQDMGSGTTFTEVSKTSLQNFFIPLPPLDEQHRIVARLDEQMAAAERARCAADQMAEAARALPSALLREIFPLRGENLPQGWRWVKLGQVAQVLKGRTPRQEWYADSGVWLVKFRDIANSTVQWTPGYRTFVGHSHASNLKPLQLGHVLISADAHDPKSIGTKVALVKYIPEHAIPAYYAGELLGVIPQTIDIRSEWIAYWFQSQYGYDVIQEAVSGVHLNAGPARNMLIPLPPLAEQERIIARLDEQMASADRARHEAEAHAKAADAIAAALLRDAFAPAL